MSDTKSLPAAAEADIEATFKRMRRLLREFGEKLPADPRANVVSLPRAREAA